MTAHANLLSAALDYAEKHAKYSAEFDRAYAALTKFQRQQHVSPTGTDEACHRACLASNDAAGRLHRAAEEYARAAEEDAGQRGSPPSMEEYEAEVASGGTEQPLAAPLEAVSVEAGRTGNEPDYEGEDDAEG